MYDLNLKKNSFFSTAFVALSATLFVSLYSNCWLHPETSRKSFSQMTPSGIAIDREFAYANCHSPPENDFCFNMTWNSSRQRFVAAIQSNGNRTETYLNREDGQQLIKELADLTDDINSQVPGPKNCDSIYATGSNNGQGFILNTSRGKSISFVALPNLEYPEAIKTFVSGFPRTRVGQLFTKAGFEYRGP